MKAMRLIENIIIFKISCETTYFSGLTLMVMASLMELVGGSVGWSILLLGSSTPGGGISKS